MLAFKKRSFYDDVLNRIAIMVQNRIIIYENLQEKITETLRLKTSPRNDRIRKALLEDICYGATEFSSYGNEVVNRTLIEMRNNISLFMKTYESSLEIIDKMNNCIEESNIMEINFLSARLYEIFNRKHLLLEFMKKKRIELHTKKLQAKHERKFKSQKRKGQRQKQKNDDSKQRDKKILTTFKDVFHEDKHITAVL